ncbi:MAG: hypothetical protein IKR39_05210 [Lachnospiraceae bacterium]|nr:hypothetical protein [Lachnospiraceae bacterium]
MESDKRVSIQTIIKYFAYAAIAVEAVFAAFWLFKNIGVMRVDYVAQTYILAADSLVVDDSMGILYALVVRVLGHGAVLQIVQIVIGTLALLFFATGLFNKSTAHALTGIVALNPVILQAETALSPGALTLACVLVAVGAAARSRSNSKWYPAIAAVALAAGFLNPDYAYLFVIGGTVFGVVTCIADKKFKLLLLALIIVSFIVPVFTNRAIRDDRAYGRVHRSPEFLMMQRVAWPHMTTYEDLVEFFVGWNIDNPNADYSVWLSLSETVPENLATEFCYKYEELIGIGNADDNYKTITEHALLKGFGNWGPDLIKDELLYLGAPATTVGTYIFRVPGTSVVNGLNYMFNGAEKLFPMYFVFSGMALIVLMLLYIVKFVVSRISRSGKGSISVTVSMIAIIFLISLYATFICLRLFDYRNVLFMVAGWPAAVMALSERKEAL